MESLRVARSARVLVLNCCWPGVMRTLREILEARPAHGIEHFMVIGDTKPEMMSALCALLRSAYLPGYACYAWREGSGAADGFAKVNGRWSIKSNSLKEDIEGRKPAKTLAGPVVDQIKDPVKLRL